MKNFFKNENGDTNIVSILVILLVIVILVMLFKNYVMDLFTQFFK